MGQIVQTHISRPLINWRNREEAIATENAYVDKVVAYAKQHGSGPMRGKVVKYSVADGYAEYVVLSTAPVRLIHLEIGDAYKFPYAANWTAKDIAGLVKMQEWYDGLFTGR